MTDKHFDEDCDDPKHEGDGVVDGTASNDKIDVVYAGDPQGDRIDANDAILPGEAPNDDIVDAGAGNDTVDAGAGNDEIYGGAGDDVLNGQAGNDVIYGDSSYDGPRDDDGDHHDHHWSWDWHDDDYDDDDDDDCGDGSGPAAAGNDTLDGGAGNDVLYGEGGDDVLIGGSGTNTLHGGGGDDTFVGGDGADSFDGGADQDNLDYSGSDEAVQVNLTDGTLSGGDAGNDTILSGIDGAIGSEHDDTLVGFDQQGTNPDDVFTNEFYGEGGDDYIDGRGGDDILDGGAGNDTIIGGSGADTMTGGDDRDTFLGGNAGDDVDGGAGGDDFDTLDLTGAAPDGGSLNVNITGPDSDGNGYDGDVTFYDSHGDETGTLHFENIEDIVPCFTPGTTIATPKGERLVEELMVGDRIITRDNGIQEIRWIGSKTLNGRDLTLAHHLKPVLIRAGALGNGLPERDMVVSPNHRVLVANDRTALYFEEHEVLVAAKHLINNRGVEVLDTLRTTYVHFMFDRHEVVLSNGSWTESFQPGDYTLNGMGNAQRTEIFDLFPELTTDAGLEGYQAARKTLKRHEARLLAD